MMRAGVRVVFLLCCGIPFLGAVTDDGRCWGAGDECRTGQCCSRWGWCGSGPAYCDPPNCISQCDSDDHSTPFLGAAMSLEPLPGQCRGPGIEEECPIGQCCSKWGWCGSGPDYCDDDNGTTPLPGQCWGPGVDEKCPTGQCCSKWGWCGAGAAYCAPSNCHSQCDQTLNPKPLPVTSLLTEELFEKMLKHRGTPPCEGRFYTYHAFTKAVEAFKGFGTTGDEETRKRELAAFFAHTSNETSGAGSPGARDDPHSWGYCWASDPKHSRDGPNYCVKNSKWPCIPGQSYYGRGPFQLRGNDMYGRAGEAIGVDLLSKPDLVATDAIISFKSALWFWMTPRSKNAPSPHLIMTGGWNASMPHILANRSRGSFGMTTHVIYRGSECSDRIGFYKRYCDILGVSYGDNLSCALKVPHFGSHDHADS